MKTLRVLALATLLGLTTSAFADDGTAARTKSTNALPVAAKTDAAPAKISHQDRMRLCAKQATGKKGPERRTFMKGCLSKKAA